MNPATIIHRSCPRCGGKLQFRHTVESDRTGAPVDFFRCEDCGYVHAVEHQPVLTALAATTKSSASIHKAGPRRFVT